MKNCSHVTVGIGERTMIHMLNFDLLKKNYTHVRVGISE